MSTGKPIPNKPFILFMYGFPGAGKTAFARQLAELISAAHVQQDRLTQELYGENTEITSRKSRKAMDYISREFLRAGVSVIYDTDVLRMSERRNIREIAKNAKVTQLLVWIQIDPESAFMRTQKRDRRKSDDHFAKIYTMQSYEAALNGMQNPENEEYVVISGKHTFQTQKAAVLKKFYELGIFTPDQLSQNIAKPGLVNLVPQTPSINRGQIPRRNIFIR